jgi:hypothetical protein
MPEFSPIHSFDFVQIKINPCQRNTIFLELAERVSSIKFFCVVFVVCVHAGGISQGCQMVYFQTKRTKLGKFWRVLQWKMLV